MAKKRTFQNYHLPPEREQLQKYFTGELDPEKINQVERKLSHSKLYLVSIKGLKSIFDRNPDDLVTYEKEVNRMLYGKEEIKSTSLPSIRPLPLIIIGVVVIIAALSIYFLTRPASDERPQKVAATETVEPERNPVVADTMNQVDTAAQVLDTLQQAEDSVVVTRTAPATEPIQREVRQDRTEEPLDEPVQTVQKVVPDAQTETDENIEDTLETDETDAPAQVVEEPAPVEIPDVVQPTNTGDADGEEEPATEEEQPEEPITTAPPTNREMPVPEIGMSTLRTRLQNIEGAQGASITVVVDEDGSINRTRVTGVSSEVETQIDQLIRSLTWRTAREDGQPIKEKLKIDL